MARDIQGSAEGGETDRKVTSREEHLEKENELLRKEIARLKADRLAPPTTTSVDFRTPLPPVDRLSRDHIERYSRQLLLSNGFGIEGQKKLLSSSVLIVGAGGIGSTVILYLAACGIGRLSIVDFDRVEVSNLHRQVLHDTLRVGQNKSESACASVSQLNPQIQCQSISEPLTYRNALDLVSAHDCVVDASDNPQTRYLLNDACVLAGKTLISGSAIGTEGQLTVYNHNGSQCYRCLYPNPPQSNSCKTCADNGVFGPVPGLIGVLQATETVKVLTNAGVTMASHLLMYDSLRCSFMRIKKPPKQPKCPSCGPDATIKTMEDSQKSLASTLGPSCSVATSKKELPPNSVSCSEYHKVRESKTPHILLDVRVQEQYDLCSLDGSIHIPLGSLIDRLDEVEQLSGGTIPVYCVCRRGVASAAAANMIHDAQLPGIHSVFTITGGLTAWQKEIDQDFPKY